MHRNVAIPGNVGTPEAKELIRDGIAARKWRPRHFAKRVGVSPSTVSRWLSGERVPDKKHIRRISALLDIPVEQLL